MNPFASVFLGVMVGAQLFLPRKLVALPYLMVFAWLPRAQVVEFGDVKISAFRIIIAAGILRMFVRRERLMPTFVAMDLVWIFFSVALVATWPFHTSDDLMFRVGYVWDYLGSYYLLRLAMSNYDDIWRLFKSFGVVLAPVGVLMLVEWHAGENPFGVLDGLPTQFREGNFRAAGPFAHPILAGTVGATCFLMGLSMWRARVRFAVLSIMAGAAIVFASASSGPLMMAGIGVCCLATWRFRAHLVAIRWWFLGALVALQLVMKDPVYFLMAKIDVVGGSTGWHRARLIQSAFEHFDEWWKFGTDRTVHWMPTGIIANNEHTDLTNHFIAMGVLGGLPLMIPLVVAIFLILRQVDRALADHESIDDKARFLAWTVGALTVAHAANFLSTNLFDQTIVSFMLLFSCAGVIGHKQQGVAIEAIPIPAPKVRTYDFATPS